MQKISNRCKVIRYSMTYNWEDNDYCMSENPADGKWVPSGDYDRLKEHADRLYSLLQYEQTGVLPPDGHIPSWDDTVDTALAAYRAEYGEE